MSSSGSPARSDLALIIVAAGSGTRLGCDGPKAFVQLGDVSLLSWCVRRLGSSASDLVVVAPAGHLEQARELALLTAPPGVSLDVVAGGATRSESVRAGLAAVRPGVRVVAVHDAARPLADAGSLRRCIDALEARAVAAAPALPVDDTLKRVDDREVVTATIDRGPLRAVQTPQVFVRAWLERAHATGGEATDDLALVEQLGGTVVLVRGTAAALKITHPADLQLASALAADDPEQP